MAINQSKNHYEIMRDDLLLFIIQLLGREKPPGEVAITPQQNMFIIGAAISNALSFLLAERGQEYGITSDQNKILLGYIEDIKAGYLANIHLTNKQSDEIKASVAKLLKH